VAVIRVNYVKKGKQERQTAKANIRYILYRSGRTAEHVQGHHGHQSDYCCGLFEMYYREGLPLVRDDPISYIFHSRSCDIFNPYAERYWQLWDVPVRENVPQTGTISPAPTVSTDNAVRARRNGNERTSRTLFGAGGDMTRDQAYTMIDRADEGSTFFRVKICPDPNKEDMKQDLLLREITEKTMAIEDHIGKPISWVAAIHDDHTDKRHVHVLAATKARYLPAKMMIEEATQACREQRLDLDYAREQYQAREQKGDEWERER